MVERDLAKVDTRVRFPSLAPEENHPGNSGVLFFSLIFGIIILFAFAFLTFFELINRIL